MRASVTNRPWYVVVCEVSLKAPSLHTPTETQYHLDVLLVFASLWGAEYYHMLHTSYPFKVLLTMFHLKLLSNLVLSY